MNRRQTVTVWLMVISLSWVSVVYGVDYRSPFYTFVVPIILIGGMLVWQFRDRKVAQALSDSTNSTRVIIVLLLVNAALVTFQARQSVELSDAVNGVYESTSEVKAETSDITTSLSELSSTLDDVKNELTFRTLRP